MTVPPTNLSLAGTTDNSKRISDAVEEEEIWLKFALHALSLSTDSTLGQVWLVSDGLQAQAMIR